MLFYQILVAMVWFSIYCGNYEAIFLYGFSRCKEIKRKFYDMKNCLHYLVEKIRENILYIYIYIYILYLTDIHYRYILQIYILYLIYIYIYIYILYLTIVSYRSARKINDYIVRSKSYPVERKVGCHRCGSSRYQICKSISITEEFTSFTTKKALK